MAVMSNEITNRLGTGSPDFPNGMPTSGGDPIVASGGNSDGEWVRWADGTQRVRLTDGDVGISEPVSNRLWNYPAAFIDIPTLEGSVSWTDAGGRIVIFIDPDATSTSYAVRSVSDTYSGSIANLTAEGRWK